MTALGRYYVARDQALEAGDEAGVLAADLGLEMVHRAPEEWELRRVSHSRLVDWGSEHYWADPRSWVNSESYARFWNSKRILLAPRMTTVRTSL